MLKSKIGIAIIAVICLGGFIQNYKTKQMAKDVAGVVVEQEADYVVREQESYGGQIRFEFDSSKSSNHEVVIRTIHKTDPKTVLLCEDFFLRIGDAKVSPSRQSGIVTEVSRGGTSTGTLRFRVESQSGTKDGQSYWMVFRDRPKQLVVFGNDTK